METEQHSVIRREVGLNLQKDRKWFGFLCMSCGNCMSL